MVVLVSRKGEMKGGRVCEVMLKNYEVCLYGRDTEAMGEVPKLKVDCRTLSARDGVT